MRTIQLEHAEQLNMVLGEHDLVVVDFYSEDCPPCEQLAPKLERAAERYPMVQVVKIFRQGFRSLAESYGVTSSPTLICFHQGKRLDVLLAGEISEPALATFFDQLIARKQHAVPQATSGASYAHDLCILGTGPAGLTASIYASRYLIDHIIVGELAGGLMTSSHKICNYPSENEISGMNLSTKMMEHVEHLGAPVLTETAQRIERHADGFTMTLASGTTVRARVILLATGTTHAHLGLPNESAFVGRGISYCATCDAAFFKHKTVAVVGGSDSANTASLYLASIAAKVYQIYRGEELRGETAWIEQVKKQPNITVITTTNVIDLHGDTVLREIELDRPFEGLTRLAIDGLFVEIGTVPEKTLVGQLGLATDEKGYVVTKPTQQTSVPGVWAAGDITTNSDGFRQIVTACSEGAIAARNIFYALKKRDLPQS